MKKAKTAVIVLLMLSLVFALAACNGDDVSLTTPDGLYLDENFTLSWRAVEGARGYDVEISAESGSPIVRKVTRASISLSNLSAGNYSVRVRAFGGADKDKYSAYTQPYTFARDLESGLVYSLSADCSQYAVTSIGTATGDIVIEDTYHGRPVTSVGAAAFRGRSLVTSVKIGANVREIAANAFFNCINLTSVTLPDGLETLGESAFQGCTSLESIDVPSGVSVINKLCFGYCRSLSSITLREGLQYIDESAFYECNSVKELTLPDSVMYVGLSAFANTSALKTFNFGEGIRYIGAGSFVDSGVQDINFKSTLDTLTVGASAFAGCVMTDIDLPEGTQTIEYGAFAGCEQLAHIGLPDTLTSVGAFAFLGTKVYDDQLEGEMIYVDDWLVGVSAKVARNVRYLKGEGDPVDGADSYDKDHDNIPDSWQGAAQFRAEDVDEENLKNYYEIRRGTVGIADNTFQYTQSAEDESSATLYDLIVPNSVKYIGYSAFGYQSNLYMMQCNAASSLQILGASAFENCSALANISLPNGLKEIGIGAFAGCMSLHNSGWNPENITPSTLERIGAYAFYDTAIWNDAQGTGGLVVAGNWIVGYDESGQWNFDGTLDSYMSNGMTIGGIADYALYNCINLQSIDISGIRKIGRSAFSGCTGLISVELSSNLHEIPDFAFYNCTSLQALTLPFDLQSIGRYAFYETALQRVDMAARRVSYIGDHAFYGCDNMTQLLLSRYLTSIEPYTFYGCRLLEQVDIPDSVTYIGERAFGKCESLAQVTFGEGLKEIGEYAFRDCERLASVQFAAVETVDSHAFYNCAALATLDLGDGITNIGEYAFANASLSEVALPESVDFVGDGAFRGCGTLKVVYIEGAPAYIGANAFGDCNQLTFYAACDEATTEGWSVMWNAAFRPVILDCGFENGVLTYISGNTSHIQAYMGVSAPTRDGYDFAGWSDVEGATTAKYGMEQLGSLAEVDRLYAVWTVKAEDVEDVTPQ